MLSDLYQSLASEDAQRYIGWAYAVIGFFVGGTALALWRRISSAVAPRPAADAAAILTALASEDCKPADRKVPVATARKAATPLETLAGMAVGGTNIFVYDGPQSKEAVGSRIFYDQEDRTSLFTPAEVRAIVAAAVRRRMAVANADREAGRKSLAEHVNARRKV